MTRTMADGSMHREQVRVSAAMKAVVARDLVGTLTADENDVTAKDI